MVGTCYMIVLEHPANYRSALRSKRRAVQVPEKCDISSETKYLGYASNPINAAEKRKKMENTGKLQAKENESSVILSF